jgi:hypothetical protein
MEEGIGRRGIAQYDSLPRERHTKVSIELADTGGEYRDLILSMPDAFTMVPKLQNRIKAVQRASINDKYAEGPHSTFGHEGSRARAAEFPWVAATCRMEQNDVDVQELCASCNVNPQLLWDHYKSVLQTDKHWQRNTRCSMQLFHERVYTCRHEFNADAADDEEYNPQCSNYFNIPRAQIILACPVFKN